MWIDYAGRLHTLSPGDPTFVIGESALGLIRRLSKRERRALARKMEALEDGLFADAQTLGGKPMDPSFVEKLPPAPVLGEVDSTEELLRQLVNVDANWRLDAFAAVEEAM